MPVVAAAAASRVADATCYMCMKMEGGGGWMEIIGIEG
jgi:hypothetical protein